MKNYILTLLLAMFQIAAFAQGANNITLNLKSQPLSVAFEEIESKSKFRFIYDENEVDLSTEVSLVAYDVPVNFVVKRLFTKVNYTHAIVGNTIKVEAKNAITTRFVEGTIKDAKGKAVVGAAIMDKAGSVMSYSDYSGYFSFDAPKGQSAYRVWHKRSGEGRLVVNTSEKKIYRVGLTKAPAAAGAAKNTANKIGKQSKDVVNAATNQTIEWIEKLMDDQQSAEIQEMNKHHSNNLGEVDYRATAAYEAGIDEDGFATNTVTINGVGESGQIDEVDGMPIYGHRYKKLGSLLHPNSLSHVGINDGAHDMTHTSGLYTWAAQSRSGNGDSLRTNVLGTPFLQTFILDGPLDGPDHRISATTRLSGASLPYNVYRGFAKAGQADANLPNFNGFVTDNLLRLDNRLDDKNQMHTTFFVSSDRISNSNGDNLESSDFYSRNIGFTTRVSSAIDDRYSQMVRAGYTINWNSNSYYNGDSASTYREDKGRLMQYIAAYQGRYKIDDQVGTAIYGLNLDIFNARTGDNYFNEKAIGRLHAGLIHKNNGLELTTMAAVNLMSQAVSKRPTDHTEYKVDAKYTVNDFISLNLHSNFRHQMVHRVDASYGLSNALNDYYLISGENLGMKSLLDNQVSARVSANDVVSLEGSLYINRHVDPMLRYLYYVGPSYETNWDELAEDRDQFITNNAIVSNPNPAEGDHVSVRKGVRLGLGVNAETVTLNVNYDLSNTVADGIDNDFKSVLQKHVFKTHLAWEREGKREKIRRVNLSWKVQTAYSIHDGGFGLTDDQEKPGYMEAYHRQEKYFMTQRDFTAGLINELDFSVGKFKEKKNKTRGFQMGVLMNFRSSNSMLTNDVELASEYFSFLPELGNLHDVVHFEERFSPRSVNFLPYLKWTVNFK